MLRYELAVDIKTGYLVWINGPFPAGAFPDVTIFRSCLAEELDEDESVEADDGYIGEAPHKVKCPGSVSNQKEKEHMQACTRMRQETINMRIKQWENVSRLITMILLTMAMSFELLQLLFKLKLRMGNLCLR